MKLSTTAAGRVLIIGLLACVIGCSYDDGPLWDKVNELDERLTQVEQTVSQFNTEATTLQTLVNTLKEGVYVTDYTKNGDKYVLTFSNGQTIEITNGQHGLVPEVGENGNWWIGTTDTGVKATGNAGLTPTKGDNGHWFIGATDTGISYVGTNGAAPTIGDNGNWFIGTTDTGVKAIGTNGLTPTIGDNGNWYIGTTDTGKPAVGKDAQTPFVGANGNWWIGTEDLGTAAAGTDGLVPHIGDNGNWWIGTTDTGVKAATGGVPADLPIIGVDQFEGAYYWTTTVNGNKTWLLDADGSKFPVGGFTPQFKVDIHGHLTYSYDGGLTWLEVFDESGNPIQVGGNCTCSPLFSNVYVMGDFLYLVLTDGTQIKVRISGEPGSRDIPADPTTPTPDVNPTNVTLPYPSIVPTVDECGNHVVLMDMTGIQDPGTGDWIDLDGTGKPGQNVWLEVDGTPKGFVVVNLEENNSRVKNDIIFTVDNSGSMDKEANAIAEGIRSWAAMLDGKGLDVRFGLVGFGGNVLHEYDYLRDDYGVTGAIDMTTADAISAYLNRASGTDRTKGYGGISATTLRTKAAQDKWNRSGGENGVQAVRFANENFVFRATANRIYINFTDDCNFTGGNSDISVDYLGDVNKWPVSNGTIHSVISEREDDIRLRKEMYTTAELPWLLSEKTNGTVMFISRDASDLRLENLKVSDALIHSYSFRFIAPDSLYDGQEHTVTITVIASDGTVRGTLTVTTVFGTL